jgi:hypothetical protein
MKPYSVKLLGWKLYIRIFIEYLLSGMIFKKEKTDDVCKICGKNLSDKRFELSITLPKLAYSFEYCEFLCLDHAIEYLFNYKRKLVNVGRT